jgi:hemin uptake protein HemP
MPADHIKESRPDSRAPSPQSTQADRVISTRELLGDARRVWIEHSSERYLLQVTRGGKLILTK